MNQSASARHPSALKKLFWRSTYATCALLAASLGVATSLWLPLPSPGIAGEKGEEILKEGGLLRPLARPVNVLVMGIDEVPDVEAGSEESFSGRSDTMLLLHLDPESEKVSLLSIPRDTQVEVPGYGRTKVNHANWMGGPALAREVVTHNFNDVQIDRYLRVNTGAFRAIIDAIGGVRVFVPKDMYYVDRTQGLEIDLQEGWQTLDGDQAEQFARFRNDVYGDIGRVQRQQTLLKALRKRFTNPTIVARLPQLLSIAQDYTNTNLSGDELMALIRFGLQLEPEEMQMVMLPGRASEDGEFNSSYWIMDEAKRDDILSSYFDVEPQSRWAQDDRSWDRVSSSKSPYDLAIAVQNASEYGDQAYHMADHLRELGFNSVYVVGDWPEIVEETSIIVQQGDLDAAKLVERRLALGQIDPASTGDLESELTIRVGSDWESPYW